MGERSGGEKVKVKAKAKAHELADCNRLVEGFCLRATRHVLSALSRDRNTLVCEPRAAVGEHALGSPATRAHGGKRGQHGIWLSVSLGGGAAKNIAL